MSQIFKVFAIKNCNFSSRPYFSRYHNDRMINYDTHRLVSVTKDRSGSRLTLVNASEADSGNYTCSPYNVRPDSVSVHVLKGGPNSSPAHAAVQNGGGAGGGDSGNAQSSSSVSGGGGGSSQASSDSKSALPVQSSGSRMTSSALNFIIIFCVFFYIVNSFNWCNLRSPS